MSTDQTLATNLSQCRKRETIQIPLNVGIVMLLIWQQGTFQNLLWGSHIKLCGTFTTLISSCSIFFLICVSTYITVAQISEITNKNNYFFANKSMSSQFYLYTLHSRNCFKADLQKIMLLIFYNILIS